ncbi:PR domain zinc finger protein 14-like [Dermacentor variabilis]|uniref:PR domain zinc finger protein 14-like n=1 Tax=Dermacentor variabilis TaxID=34621 RepID=UPI003F5C0CE6
MLQCPRMADVSHWCRKVVSWGDVQGPWRVATANKPFKCSTCSKRFCSTESLRVHLYYMHRAIKMHVCQRCGRCYKKRYDLRKHWERSPLCDELNMAVASSLG